jgi:VWFA-related protein
MLLVLFSLLFLQEPAATEPPRFTSRSDLVVLHVSVLDRKRGYVSGLTREAFTVHEDGRPQAIEFFEAADSPVTVGLAIDSSISMQRRRDAVIAAGVSFARSGRPDDEMFTINFNERVWPGLPDGRQFTSDPEELRLALLRSGARGKTALFDGLHAGLTQLEGGHRQKKVLIVVSDGGDNASTLGFDDVLAAALRMDAVIYTVSIDDPYDREARPDVLRKLAASTGGEAFFLRTASEATSIFERISRDIRSGYTIGYAPAGSAGHVGYRAIKVDVRPPDGRKLTVRARSGYVAGAGGQ